jgi:proton glutamate symport protein
MKKSISYFSYILLGLITINALAFVLQIYQFLELDYRFLTGLRIALLLAFVVYAFWKKNLTIWILVSLFIGAEVGYSLPQFAKGLQFLSDIFLRLIKTIIAPLLFATLVNGIAGHTNLRQIGRMGWKSLLYFEIVSTIALFIGLAAINISKAGVGLTLPSAAVVPIEVKTQTTTQFLLHIFPENIAKAIFEGNILQIVIFSIIFGVALTLVKKEFKDPMIRFTGSLAETMFKFTGIVMYFAPVAVFGAIACAIGNMGAEVLFTLFKLLSTLYVALIVFLIGVLLPVALLFRIPIRSFMQAVSKPASIAFATANSESALPSAMESMEQFGVPRKIVSFVIPTGYSFNLDGSTLYLTGFRICCSGSRD